MNVAAMAASLRRPRRPRFFSCLYCCPSNSYMEPSPLANSILNEASVWPTSRSILDDSTLVRSSPLASRASISSSVMLDPLERKISSAPNLTMCISSPVSSRLSFSTRRPCWMTTASMNSLRSARSTIFSSTVPSVMKRNTRTCFFCPMRCARSCACRSICGFQSLSYRMTTSAVYRLMPRPPARVDSRKAKCGEPGALNSSIWRSRSSLLVCPSMRQ
mmetsp:Transcript_2524/g.7433  ORF Transcript_2524/g.7433 Transcript_2524/m.7433 type:complete len:218 (+) Transcript_2524:1244-1897(+)